LTLEKLLEIIPKLEEEYGDNLPDPEHQPIQFAHIVRLHLYYDRPTNISDKCDPAEKEGTGSPVTNSEQS
jgi:hypothetical protein